MKMIPFVFAEGEAVMTTTTAVTTEAQPAAPAAEGATAKPAQQQSGFSMIVPMLIIFGLFYFMMIRPQQRKEKERRKMIDELRAGTTVMLASGFIGKIVEASEKTFKVEIADGVVVEVARSAVQSLVNAEAK